MTKAELPVIAVIPNYNMADSLRTLLPQLIAQKYSKIFVLDDLSTDSSKQVVREFGSVVTWVGGTENLGSGGNRNRILKAQEANCIIHFIDADVRLLSDAVVSNAHKVMATAGGGFVGGLVIEHGRQSIWNFGPDITQINSSIGGLLQHVFGRKQAKRPWWRAALRYSMQPYLLTMPDLALPPKRQKACWVHEANMLIEWSTLKALGGFDTQIREHDIMPLAFKAQQAGLQSYFDPAIAVEHTFVKVRDYNRIVRRFWTAHYLRRTYHVKIWA